MEISGINSMPDRAIDPNWSINARQCRTFLNCTNIFIAINRSVVTGRLC